MGVRAKKTQITRYLSFAQIAPVARGSGRRRDGHLTRSGGAVHQRRGRRRTKPVNICHVSFHRCFSVALDSEGGKTPFSGLSLWGQSPKYTPSPAQPRRRRKKSVVPSPGTAPFCHLGRGWAWVGGVGHEKGIGTHRREERKQNESHGPKKNAIPSGGGGWTQG